MQRLVPVVALGSTLAFAAACGTPPPSEYGTVDDAIVNGRVDDGHDTVGYVWTRSGGACTGTLVGRRTVVTAAHCIDGDGPNHFFGIAGEWYPVAAAEAHPSWDPDVSYGIGANDIAVLLLEHVPPVEPTPVATRAPYVGQALTLVGYGVTGEDEDDGGTKRIATTEVARVTATKLFFAGGRGLGNTCYGDSGGPAFANVSGREVLVGVTSGGETPCEVGDSWDTRVDAYVDWLSAVSGGDLVLASSAITDTKKPSVRITSPRANAYVRGSLTVSATLSDNVGVVRAELLVDDALAGELTAAPWRFPVQLAPGSHRLRVYGYDAAGNRGQYTISVTVR